MNKQYVYIPYITIVLFSFTYNNNLSLFDIVARNDLNFLRNEFHLLPTPAQEHLLTALNETHQTPLHYALSLRNIPASYILITLIHDPAIFFNSDDQENTPWWLAQEIPHTNLFALMRSRVPHHVEL